MRSDSSVTAIYGIKQYKTMEKDLIYKISGLNELYDAFYKAQKNSNWKASVQNLNLIFSLI